VRLQGFKRLTLLSITPLLADSFSSLAARIPSSKDSKRSQEPIHDPSTFGRVSALFECFSHKHSAQLQPIPAKSIYVCANGSILQGVILRQHLCQALRECKILIGLSNLKISRQAGLGQGSMRYKTFQQPTQRTSLSTACYSLANMLSFSYLEDG